MAKGAHFILYVQDQKRSKEFYQAVLQRAPILDAPGITEFEIFPGAILGLMPEEGIQHLLGYETFPNPKKAHGVPRSELYLKVEDPKSYHTRAIEMGATELSELSKRDWGHWVAYSLDLDGHVLAFASETEI